MNNTLFLYARKGQEPLFNYLLSKEANIFAISSLIRKKLLIAAIDGQNPQILTTILEQKKIDLLYKDNSGRTALHHAANSDDSVYYLAILFSRGAIGCD